MSDTSDSTIQGMTDKAAELARSVKGQAMEFAGKAAEQVKEHSGQLGQGAKEVASDAADKLLHAVENQKGVGAGYVAGWAGAVRKAADGFEGEIPQAAQYIRSAADQIDSVATAIQQRNMGELMQEVQSFARRQPTAFLGLTMLAGFAAVRFLKSSAGAPAQGQNGGKMHQGNFSGSGSQMHHGNSGSQQFAGANRSASSGQAGDGYSRAGMNSNSSY